MNRLSEKKIVVAMIADHPADVNAPCGGVQAVIAALAPHLAAKVDLHIVWPQRNSARRGVSVVESIVDGRSVQYKVHGTRAFPLTGLSYFTLNRLALIAYLRHSIQPDLVHVQGPSGFLPLYGYPSVLTIHGVAEKDVLFSGYFASLKSWLLKKVEVRGRRSADRIIAISSMVKTIAGVNAIKTVSIPNPIVQDFFDLERSPISGRVLWAGKITPLKNPELALRLIARTTSAHLIIAGSGSAGYVDKMKGLANELGIASRIEFLGELDRSGLMAQFRQAELLLMTSRQENAPMIIAEAMAAGVPVVATDVGAIKDMTEGTQRVLCLSSESALHLALQEVLDSSEVRGQMSSAGRHVALKFSAKAVTDSTLTAYGSLLSSESSFLSR